MKILTYTSSVSLPSTIFTGKILLQNTQTRLSYTHIHFTNTTEINTNCNVLAVDMTALTEKDLDIIKRKYCKTIIWSDDVVSTVLWFIEMFDRDSYKYYVVVSNNNNMDVQERDVDVQEAFKEEPATDGEGEKSSPIKEYLDHKFNELEEENRSVEKIFSRLSLMKNRKQ